MLTVAELHEQLQKMAQKPVAAVYTAEDAAKTAEIMRLRAEADAAETARLLRL